MDETSTTRRTPASAAAANVTAAPSTFTDRIAARLSWIGSAAAAWTSTSAPRSEAARVGRQTDVAVELLDPSLERRVVERSEVERPHGVTVGDEAPCEMQAEEARAARDRDQHGAES